MANAKEMETKVTEASEVNKVEDVKEPVEVESKVTEQDEEAVSMFTQTYLEITKNTPEELILKRRPGFIHLIACGAVITIGILLSHQAETFLAKVLLLIGFGGASWQTLQETETVRFEAKTKKTFISKSKLFLEVDHTRVIEFSRFVCLGIDDVKGKGCQLHAVDEQGIEMPFTKDYIPDSKKSCEELKALIGDWIKERTKDDKVEDTAGYWIKNNLEKEK